MLIKGTIEGKIKIIVIIRHGLHGEGRRIWKLIGEEKQSEWKENKDEREERIVKSSRGIWVGSRRNREEK